MSDSRRSKMKRDPIVVETKVNQLVDYGLFGYSYGVTCDKWKDGTPLNLNWVNIRQWPFYGRVNKAKLTFSDGSVVLTESKEGSDASVEYTTEKLGPFITKIEASFRALTSNTHTWGIWGTLV